MHDRVNEACSFPVFFQFQHPTDHMNRPKALVSSPVYHYQRLSEEDGLTENGYLVTVVWGGWIPGTALVHSSKFEVERNSGGKKTFGSLETPWFKMAAL